MFIYYKLCLKSQGGNKKNRNIKSKTVLFSNSNFWSAVLVWIFTI